MGRTLFSGTCLFMLLGVSTAAAQTEKGSKLIGATIGGASYAKATSTEVIDDPIMDTVYEQKSDSYSVFAGPTVGWFVKDNLAVGIGIGVGYSRINSDFSSNFDNITQTLTTTTPSVLGGPFARYYFGGSTSAKPFVGASASLVFAPSQRKGSSSVGEEYEIRITPKGSYGAGLAVGYEQFLNKSVGLVFSSGVNYSHMKFETRLNYQSSAIPSYSETRTQTNKGWSIPLNVGLEIHFQ